MCESHLFLYFFWVTSILMPIRIEKGDESEEKCLLLSVQKWHSSLIWMRHVKLVDLKKKITVKTLKNLNFLNQVFKI